MNFQKTIRAGASAALLTASLLAGCKSAEQKALDDAKAQAAATNTAQQISYVDKNGDTVTTVVSPPMAGQAQQINTTTAPPPPGPKPTRTKPVITPVGGHAVVSAAGPVAGAAVTPSSGSSMPDAATQTAQAGGALPGSSAGAPPAYVAPPADVPDAMPAPAVNVSLPAGTELSVRINQTINVKHAHAGDRFNGEMAAVVERDGNVVIPRGTPVSGRVDAAHRRGHFKGHSYLELQLTAMRLNGHLYAIDTHDYVRTKKGKGKRTAGWISGLTGAGMIIGGIATGGVGLAIGAASGAGAGTLIAGTTGNRDLVIPAESVVHFRLADRLVLQNE